MSFDEKQQLDNDEIDLAHLLRIIWSSKYILLIFIFLSVPISVWLTTTMKPTYKAETVFEKPSEKAPQTNTSLQSSIQGSSFLSFLTGGIGAGGDSFFSEIRSQSFLETVILNNTKLDSQIRQFCPLPSKETSRFSLRSLLILLGISENKSPSESQKTSLLVQCVNNMLEVDFDNFGGGESSAFRLSIESGDPDFSANLANQIVEKYFTRYEKKRDQDFQNIKKYLSKVIAEAQLEYAEANKLIQSFTIKYSLLMNEQLPSAQNKNYLSTVFKEGGVSVPASPFVGELNREMAKLSQLEKSLSELNQTRLLLSNLKELNQEEIKAFISSNNVPGVLSRTFIAAIAKINDLSAGTGIINQKIMMTVSQELESLMQQIQVLEKKIDKLEGQTMQLMSIENEFQELAMDVSKKLLIFEGLKDQLKEKILTAGLANVAQRL